MEMVLVVYRNIPSTMTNLDRSFGQFCLRASYRDHKTEKSGAEGPLQVSAAGRGLPGPAGEGSSAKELRFDGQTPKFGAVVSRRTCC